MTLIQKIQQKSIAARKTKDEMSPFWITLLSECQMVGKNKQRETTDDEVISVIKKFIAGAEQIFKLSSDGGIKNKANKEINCLSEFLPAMLPHEDIVRIIDEFLIDKEIDQKQMGSIMKHFKDNYANQYDSKILSGLVIRILNPDKF